MSPETNSPQTTKICPTCGTRLGINATRCSVCGSNLAPAVNVSSAKAVAGPRVREVTMSVPLVIVFSLLLLAAGAAGVFAFLRSQTGAETPLIAQVTDTATPTATGTVTITPTASMTATFAATWTPLPPIEYSVASGDTCILIAYNFNVSVNSIVVLNGLPATCDTLSIGQKLLIPQPTPTASPAPTNTLNPTEMVQQECEKVDYDVKDGDTLQGIALNYGITMASIRVYNGMNNDIVFAGQKLVIPLCEQTVETATPTPVPPYAAPNLLLPADGAAFVNAGEVISLQWASIGELRENEAYAVTIEDVTDGNARKLVEYVKDTNFTVPDSFRPATTTPHVYRWSVFAVRQTGTDENSGEPTWEPAGAVSGLRVFSWVGGQGGGAAAPTVTPQP